MLIDVDLNKSKIKPRLSIAKPNKEIIGSLKEAYNIKLNIKLGNINELSFDLPYKLELNNKLKDNPHINFIKYKYLIKLEFGNFIEWYQIENPQPTMNEDSDVLSVQCYSLPYEMRNKKIKQYKKESVNAIQILTDVLTSLYEVDISKCLWKPDYIAPEFNTMYRTFDISQKSLLDFLLSDIVETFDATIIFNTLNRTFSLYKQEDIGVNKGFKIDYGKLLKSLNASLNIDEFCTRLKCYGNDNLTITAVNPLGKSYLEDFSFFLGSYEEDELGNIVSHSEYLSDSLCGAILDYNTLVSSKNKELDTADIGTTTTWIGMVNHGLVTGDYILNRSRSNEVRRITVVNPDAVTLDLYETSIKYALEGTTTTNVHIINHGLNSGDYIANKTRSNERRQITKVDDDNFTVASISGQTTDDEILLEKYSIDDQTNGDTIYKYKDGTFGKLLYQKRDLQKELTALENELNNVLTPQLLQKLDEIAVAEQHDDPVGSLIAERDAIQAGINTQLGLISAKETEITNKNTEIDDLRSLLSIESNFTESHILELNQFIIEDIWEDNKYIDAFDLYEEGLKRFADINSPKDNIEINIVNLLEIIECQHDWDKLVLGDQIRLKNDNLKIDVFFNIIEMNFNFESGDIDLVIGDIKKVTSDKDSVIDKINKSIDTANDLNNKAINWNALAQNFDARNDRNPIPPADPVIANNGTAIDHTLNTDGSCNISFEWFYNGTGGAYDIDGFFIRVRSTTSNQEYVFGSNIALEQIQTVDKYRRSMIIYGVPANKYYTFGVQAYRKVDADINPDGILTSNIVKSSYSAENPYHPEQNVAFAGDVTGTIDGKPVAEVVDFIDVTYLNDLSNIQSQIDGQITTWFYEYEPTLLNLPSSEWTTNELKNNHLGDLFYNTDTGYAYRFAYINSVYQWKRITDTDVVKALADAKNAQDTADRKRTVFLTTPETPYNKGDLWRVSANEVDFKICTTERLTGDYVTEDWEYATDAKGYVDTQVDELNDSINDLDITITETFSDAKLTNIEANSLKVAFNNMNKEATDIMAIASGLGMTADPTYITCQDAIDALETETGKWVGQETYPLDVTTIDRTNIITKFTALKESVTNLENAINLMRDTTVRSYVDGEISELDSAITGLETNIDGFSSDLKLTFAEANAMKISLEQVNSESIDIINIATSFSITTEKDNYSTALATLANYLNDNWLNKAYPLTVTSVQRTNVITYFKDVESTKSALNKKILEVQNTNSINYIDGQVSDLDDAISNLNTTITNAFSDSKITNIEANSLKISFDSLVKEATDVRNIAVGLSLSSHASYIACGTAITNLQTEINKWVGKTSYPLTITTTDRTNITNKFQALEGAIASLYDAIDIKRQSNTVEYVDGEINELDSAINNLESDLSDFSSDLKLTLAEANSIKLSLENVISESTDIIAIAASLAITTEKTAYSTALTTLTNYLNTNWLNKTYPLTVTAAQRTNVTNYFKDVEAKKSTLNQKIIEVQSAKTSADLTTFINETTSGLQTQIDGKINSYFQEADPNTWLVADRPKHNGDMWYKASTKFLGRYNATTNAWEQIIDQTAIAAYDLAQQAQDTADGKRRVFTTTPFPPYDIGDLWAAGSSGDLKRCKTAKATGQSYSASDWELATKYTDDSSLDAFISSIYNDDLAGLQSQIDGKITTWFYSYAPTLTNLPASSWSTNADKDKHLGDLFYDLNTGYAYRFAYISSAYKWDKITDSDVTKALQDASKAQDTADSKRRVFTTTPTPPYDPGDLWAGGSGSDLKKCKIAKLEGQSYSASDWELATKYTDDTTALLALANATNAQETADGQIQGFFQTTAPVSGMSFGDIWIDTDGHTPPTTADIYRYEDTNHGSQGTLAWRATPTNAIGIVYLSAYNAQETANSKITTFYQDEQPTAKGTGDLWVDTNDNNKIYRWNGSSWGLMLDTIQQDELYNYVKVSKANGIQVLDNQVTPQERVKIGNIAPDLYGIQLKDKFGNINFDVDSNGYIDIKHKDGLFDGSTLEMLYYSIIFGE